MLNGEYIIGAQKITAPELAPGLYIVATPIGNMADISLRALNTLAAVDMLACEDTRITGKLLKHYGISARMITYNDHDGARARPRILNALKENLRVALVSDAGTPLISDPGYRLVCAAAAQGSKIIPIPGASALLAALMASGQPSDAIHFAGFLPRKPGARQERLRVLARSRATIVIFETAKRITNILPDLCQFLGAESPVVIAREMTKLHEEFIRATLGQISARLDEITQKGEWVLVIAPQERELQLSGEELDQLISRKLAAETLNDTAKSIAEMTGLGKRQIYERALQLRARLDAEN